MSGLARIAETRSWKNHECRFEGDDLKPNGQLARALTASGLTVPVLSVIALAWIRGPEVVAAPTANRISSKRVYASCPLTEAQQEKSVAAWKKMMPVFRHPRCSNCHGGIPSALPERTNFNGVSTGGATVRHSDIIDMDSTDTPKTCEDCHMDGWGAALGAPDWKKRTDEEICSVMHTRFLENAPAFVDHIVRDGGGTQFIEAGFKGLRGLTDGGLTIYEGEKSKKLLAEKPPGTHAQLIAQARAWVAAQGGKFVGDADCGCKVRETGEVYMVTITSKNTSGAAGFTVTDRVSMKVRIKDTTVTVYDIMNEAPSSIPARIQGPPNLPSIEYVPEPIGEMNIVEAKGHVALDYPEDGVRELKVDFTHDGPMLPLFLLLGPKTYRATQGGGAASGLPFSFQFVLQPGTKVYDNGVDFMHVTMTLVSEKK